MAALSITVNGGVDPGVIWNWTTDGGTTVTQASDASSWQYVDELIAAANDQDAVSIDANQTKTLPWRFTTPADFESITTLTVSARLFSNAADDSGYHYFQVFAADGTTGYTDEVSFSQSGTYAVQTVSMTFALTAAGLAATKTDWDAARLSVRFRHVANMGADTGKFWMSAVELGGTYTATAAGTTVPVGRALESGVAQPVGKTKARAIVQSSEIGSAQSVGPAKVASLGQVVESSAAQLVAKAKVKAVGQSAEADTALALEQTQTIAIGQALEAQAAQPVANAMTAGVAQAAEGDAAQPLSRSKARPTAQVIETDEARPVTPAKIRQLAQAAETDAASAVSEVKVRALGQSQEAGAAQAVTALKGADILVVGPAAETSTAQPIAVLQARVIPVGRATEAQSASAVTPRRSYVVASASEISTAGGLAVRKTRTVGQSSSIELGMAIAPLKPRSIPLGQAAETNTARVVSVVVVVELPPVVVAQFAPGSTVDAVPIVPANRQPWAHERRRRSGRVEHVRPVQAPLSSTVADATGTATFETLPAGDYWIVGEREERVMRGGGYLLERVVRRFAQHVD